MKFNKINRSFIALCSSACISLASGLSVVSAAALNAPRAGVQQGAFVTQPAQPVSFADYVAQNGLTQKYQALSAIFPHTTTGQAIARVATLAPNGLKQDNIPAERELGLDLATLRASPDQALSDLETGFKTLPETYWPERQFLIQVASRWAAAPGSVQAFLESEIKRPITRNPEDPSDLSGYTPAIAVDALSNVITDRVQLHDVILRDLQAQPDKDVQRTALVRYEVVDAVRAGQIATQLGLVAK